MRSQDTNLRFPDLRCGQDLLMRGVFRRTWCPFPYLSYLNFRVSSYITLLWKVWRFFFFFVPSPKANFTLVEKSPVERQTSKHTFRIYEIVNPCVLYIKTDSVPWKVGGRGLCLHPWICGAFKTPYMFASLKKFWITVTVRIFSF